MSPGHGWHWSWCICNRWLDAIMPENWLIWRFSKYFHSIHTGSISLQNGRRVHQQPDEFNFLWINRWHGLCMIYLCVLWFLYVLWWGWHDIVKHEGLISNSPWFEVRSAVNGLKTIIGRIYIDGLAINVLSEECDIIECDWLSLVELLIYYAIDALLTVINLLGNPFIGFQILMILNCCWLVAR